MRGIHNDVLQEGLEIFFKPYLEGYRNRVTELYVDEHEKSDSFQFMNPITLHVLLRGKNTFLIITKSERDQINFFDCSEFPYDDFKVLFKGPSKLKNRFIESAFSISKYLARFPYYDLGNHAGIMFSEGNREYLIERSKLWGIAKADSHELDYRFNEAFQSAIEPSVELSNIDTDLIIEKVNNPSFEYEFGESVKAYNAGIYLAAAATGGMALENILRILIQRKTKEKLPDQSFIKLSLPILKRGNILPGRLYNSVDSLKNVRNANAHTNEDPVKKATVDHIYSVIEDLAYLL